MQRILCVAPAAKKMQSLSFVSVRLEFISVLLQNHLKNLAFCWMSIVNTYDQFYDMSSRNILFTFSLRSAFRYD